MASLGRGGGGGGGDDGPRRAGMSPRPRGRGASHPAAGSGGGGGGGGGGGRKTDPSVVADSAKDTLCRNVTIYGHCRYENKGCAFNHDPSKVYGQPDGMKKRLNVDSPSFTPASGSPNLTINGLAKTPGLSPKAANAAPFKPKGLGGAHAHAHDFSTNPSRKAPSQYNPSTADWAMASAGDVPDFVPQAQSVGQNLTVVFHLPLFSSSCSSRILFVAMPRRGRAGRHHRPEDPPPSVIDLRDTTNFPPLAGAPRTLPTSPLRAWGPPNPTGRAAGEQRSPTQTANVLGSEPVPEMAPLLEAVARAAAMEAESATAGDNKAEPATADVNKAEPATAGDNKAEPATAGEKKAEPAMTRGDEAEPATTRDDEAGPTTTRGNKSKSATTRDDKAEPTTTRDNKAEPTTTRDDKVEPAATGGDKTEPASIEADQTEPAPARDETVKPTTARDEDAEPNSHNLGPAGPRSPPRGLASQAESPRHLVDRPQDEVVSAPSHALTSMYHTALPSITTLIGLDGAQQSAPNVPASSVNQRSANTSAATAHRHAHSLSQWVPPSPQIRALWNEIPNETIISTRRDPVSQEIIQTRRPRKYLAGTGFVTPPLLPGLHRQRSSSTHSRAASDISNTAGYPYLLLPPPSTPIGSPGSWHQDEELALSPDQNIQSASQSRLRLSSSRPSGSSPLRYESSPTPHGHDPDSPEAMRPRDLLANLQLPVLSCYPAPRRPRDDSTSSPEFRAQNAGQSWARQSLTLPAIRWSRTPGRRASPSPGSIDSIVAASLSRPCSEDDLRRLRSRHSRLDARSEPFTPSSEPSLATQLIRRNITAPQPAATQTSPVVAPSIPHPSPHKRKPAHSWSCPEISPRKRLTGETSQDPSALSQGLFDPYNSTPGNGSHASAQINPYLHDQAGNSASYFPSNTFVQPLNYHLYVSQAPYRDHLAPNQRTARDFFISDTLREDMQRKSAMTQQTLPNSTLPQAIDYFHSLVPLDTNNQKNATLFGHPSWIYKVQSAKDGRYYALRRLEGFRLTNENAVITVKQNWKKITNASIVQVMDIFTNRSFGDAGLMVVTDYFPLSKTLADAHLSNAHSRHFRTQPFVPESVLWTYFVQIVNALKIIHAAGLAARVLDPSKILVTDKNRIRLNGCGILDVVQFDSARSIAELQQEDMAQLGRLMLILGTNNRAAVHSPGPALEQLGRAYSATFKERVAALIGMAGPVPRIDTVLVGLETIMLNSFDAALNEADTVSSELHRELENSRIARLMIKINFITERPEYGLDRQWSETGERYPIKLFRDYVFHQVDGQGNPSLDLGWVLACLNKLDAGSEEKMRLVTRDEQTLVILSFKDMKRLIEGAYQELVRAGRASGR